MSYCFATKKTGFFFFVHTFFFKNNFIKNSSKCYSLIWLWSLWNDQMKNEVTLCFAETRKSDHDIQRILKLVHTIETLLPAFSQARGEMRQLGLTKIENHSPIKTYVIIFQNTAVASISLSFLWILALLCTFWSTLKTTYFTTPRIAHAYCFFIMN